MSEGASSAPSSASTVLYFAIASMTNPAALANRGLRPLRSWPAELLDYALRFDLGRVGMADACACAGASFHGVLHELSAEDWRALELIEAGYTKAAARARKYDGAIVECVVFSVPRNAETGRPLAWLGAGEDVEPLPPSQRYVELIVAGCRHFGVAESHCAALLALETTPRTRPEDFRGYPVPADAPVWNEARFEAEPEAEDSVVISLNGKVLRVAGDWGHYLKRNKAHGARYELIISRTVLDVKYGTPASLEGFSREHASYIEDFFLRGFGAPPGARVEVIALLPQRYRDDAAGGGAAASPS